MVSDVIFEKCRVLVVWKSRNMLMRKLKLFIWLVMKVFLLVLVLVVLLY